MKYSVIITYRDIEKHLSQLLPVLQKKFQDKDYEIIISEQDDDKKFRKNDLYNLAVREYAKGDVLIFHNCIEGTTEINPNVLHGGSPVISGEKWAVNLWFRESAIY